MSDRSISATYNPRRNEAWFEIPEEGLGHSTGLYRRRLNSIGNPLEPAPLVSSTYMFQPRVEFNSDRDEYLLGYSNAIPFGRPAIVQNTRTGQFLALLKGKARRLLNVEFKAVLLDANGRGRETPHTIGIVDSRWPPSLAYNPVANEFGVFYSGHLGGSVKIDQRQQLIGELTDGLATLKGSVQKLFDLWNQCAESSLCG